MENMIQPLAACVLAWKRIKEQVKQDGLRTTFFKKNVMEEGEKEGTEIDAFGRKPKISRQQEEIHKWNIIISK